MTSILTNRTYQMIAATVLIAVIAIFAFNSGDENSDVNVTSESVTGETENTGEGVTNNVENNNTNNSDNDVVNVSNDNNQNTTNVENTQE